MVGWATFLFQVVVVFFRNTIMYVIETLSQERHDLPISNCNSVAQHGAQLGLTGPRWAPCWPHELCYLECYQPLSEPIMISSKDKYNVAKQQAANTGFQLCVITQNVSHIIDIMEFMMHYYTHIFSNDFLKGIDGLIKDQVYGKWMYTVHTIKIEYNKVKYSGGIMYRENYSSFHWIYRLLYLESIC